MAQNEINYNIIGKQNDKLYQFGEPFDDCGIDSECNDSDLSDDYNIDPNNDTWNDCGSDTLCPNNNGYIEPDEDGSELNGLWDENEGTELNGLHDSNNNVEEYFRIVFGDQAINETIDMIQNLVKSILYEELEEGSFASAGAVAGGGVGGSKPSNTDEDEDDDKDKEDPVEEALAPYNELPHQAGSASTITVKVIPHSRSKTDGGVSDAGYKRSVNNRFKIDGRLTNKRAPYYDEGDIVHSLVEKVLRNIIRAD